MKTDFPLRRDPGSFRDPAGYVFSNGRNVFRTLSDAAECEYKKAKVSGLIQTAIQRGLLIASDDVAVPTELSHLRGARGETPKRILEHPRIPLISYAYEWTFGQLREAALRHLELHLLALEHGFDLSDATAYNMQFDTGDAFHIDVLSIRRYRPGQPWQAYNQFCRQFLFPLLLENSLGLPFQRIYRGNLGGIEASDMKLLVPLWRRLTNLNMMMHVQLHSSAIQRWGSSGQMSHGPQQLPEIPKARYVAMLEGLRDWIAALKSGRPTKTYWADYATTNTYSDLAKQSKHAFVRHAIRVWKCNSVLDVGGNSGDYSVTALTGGASRAYCVDGDIDALEIAYAKRKSGCVGLLPLVIDWSDPSPAQGWASKERPDLAQRLHVDAVLALAVIHHIVIGSNIPLAEFFDRLFVFGKHAIVEFIPKNDPMVQGLLQRRNDIFEDYTEENFIRLLEERAEIQQVHRISSGGRVLFACRSHAAPF